MVIGGVCAEREDEQGTGGSENGACHCAGPRGELAITIHASLRFIFIALDAGWRN
jgi:hypothetical protein